MMVLQAQWPINGRKLIIDPQVILAWREGYESPRLASLHPLHATGKQKRKCVTAIDSDLLAGCQILIWFILKQWMIKMNVLTVTGNIGKDCQIRKAGIVYGSKLQLNSHFSL